MQDVLHAGERAAELTRKMLAYAGKTNMFKEPTDLNKVIREACKSVGDSVPEEI